MADGQTWSGVWRGHLARLLPMLAGLLALLPEGTLTLTREKRLEFLATLRPVEAIARRIITVAAKEVVVEVPPKRAASGKRKKGGKRKRPDLPAFPLFDRRKRVGPPPSRKAKGFGPNIRGLDGLDPVPPRPAPAPKPDDVMDVGALQRRLAAVRAAMGDVEGYALRLARRLARGTTKYTVPMRVGRPPGHRAQRVTAQGYPYRGWRAVDALLVDANWFAWASVRGP